MHVLMIHQVFVSMDDVGGTRHYEMAQALLEAGHEVTIVASDVSYLTGKKHSGSKNWVSEEWIDGVRVLRAYTYPSLHGSYAARAWSFGTFMLSSFGAALRAKKVDIVFGTSPPIFQAPSAAMVAKLLRVPFIFEVRDLWPEFAVDMGILSNPLLIKTAETVEMTLYKAADQIMVNSPAYEAYIKENKGIAADRIRTIANGVDPEMLNPAKVSQSTIDEIRASWNVETDDVVLLYAGALGPAQDLDTALEVAKKLPQNVKMVLLGAGKMAEHLQQRVTNENIKNVRMPGAVPKSAMNAHLAAGDLFFAILQNIPMFTTNYPNKVFDYLSAAKPIVLAIDGVIREVVESSGGGVFAQPGDVDAIVACVNSLLLKRDEWAVMGASGRAYVQQHFNRRDQAAKFVSFLEEVAAR